MTTIVFWLLWGAILTMVILGIGARLAAFAFQPVGRQRVVSLIVAIILLLSSIGVMIYVLLNMAMANVDAISSGTALLGTLLAFFFIAALLVYDLRGVFRMLRLMRWYRKANAFLAHKQYDEALTAYDRVLSLSPNFAMALYGRAQALVYQHRYAESLVTCKYALELSPGSGRSAALRVRILVLMGNTLSLPRRYADALAATDEALALMPDYREAWAQKAYLLQRMDTPERALEAARHALETRASTAISDDWRGMALVAMAGALSSLGSYAEALDVVAQALPIAPHSSTLKIVEANSLSHLGRQAAAEAAAIEGVARAEQQLAVNAERADVWENKGTLLRMLGRVSEAEAAETRAQTIIKAYSGIAG